MKLKDYQNNDKTKIENLTKFLDDNANWQIEYIDNPDYIGGYYDLIELGTIYYDNCEYEIKELLKSEIEKNGIDFLFDNDLIDASIHYGSNRCDNELWSYTLGEIEVQFTGLYDHKSNIHCIYTELIKGMSEIEIDKSHYNSEHYISNDCLYIDMSYDRASFLLKENEFLEYLKKPITIGGY